MNNNKRIHAGELRRFCKKVFVNASIPEREAVIIADTLVYANEMGVDSHGVTRLADYISRLEKGVIKNHTKIDIVNENESTALLDANNGWGQYAGTIAVKKAVEKAKSFGSSIVGVRNSNHFGAASYFTRMAADENCLGIAMTNASPLMVSWGAKKPTLGTNPISIAVPAKRYPVILDMATSNTARGRINLAAKNNESIPEGWAITADGFNTTDAKEALNGFLLPFGAKGSGLAMMIDIMTGVMTGAMFGESIPRMYDDSEPQQLGHLFIVFNIESFMDIDLFKDRMSERINQTNECPPASGFNKVYMPGEMEQMKLENSINDGITLSEAIYIELKQLGKRYDSPIDDFITETV